MREDRSRFLAVKQLGVESPPFSFQSTAGLFLMLAAVLAIASAGFDRSASADDSLSRYYAGLRQRGLFRLAESDCLRRLANDRLTTGERANLSIELSAMYAEHALHSSGQERDELWERAIQALDVEQQSPEAYQELLIAQRGFVKADRGALLRWQVELFPLDARGREKAADALRKALETLTPLPSAFDKRIRDVIASPPDLRDRSDQPAPARLSDTRREVEFRIAEATLDLAKVLPIGPDREAALHDAESKLREVAKTPKPDEAAWVAEVLLIEVLRLRGDLARVGPRVSALFDKDPPRSVRNAAMAQWVRADLDANRPDDALERLQSYRREHGKESGELTHLLVETLLAARRLAFDKQEPSLARDLLTQAETYASDLDGAWGARSRVRVESAREADKYGQELADHVRRAKWAWRNGNLEEAIAAYHQAVSEAHRSGRKEFAVDFAMTLASLQNEARRYDGSVITLTGLLDNYPETPRAADARLLRAYALGRQYEQRPDDASKAAYRDALQQHRDRYADSPTTIEATWMLARLEEHERNWQDAITLLESIPAESKRGEEAQARLAAVYEQALADREQRGEPTQELEKQAVTALTAAVETFPSRPKPLSVSQAEIAWRLARLLLSPPQTDFAAADTLLERVLNSKDADGNSASRVAAASQLRIISLAGQGRLDEARAFVQQLQDGQPDRLLDVLSGLTTAAKQVAFEHKRTVGTLQLELSQNLDARRETLSEVQRLKLDESLAQAHAALGQLPQAAAVYEKVLWQRPTDTRVIKALAELYESGGTISSLRNAAKQWQALERLKKKGSMEWLEARYHLASCSYRIGDEETARKLVGVTKVLYPELGNPNLKARYDELAAELESDRRQPPAQK